MEFDVVLLFDVYLIELLTCSVDTLFYAYLKGIVELGLFKEEEDNG